MPKYSTYCDKKLPSVHFVRLLIVVLLLVTFQKKGKNHCPYFWINGHIISSIRKKVKVNPL